MEYLVTMTTRVPEGTSDDLVAEVRTREANHSRGLADRGALLRLWRPPAQPGEWRTYGLFAATDEEDLGKMLASMPLRIWRSDDVTPLAPHPNDAPLELRRPRGSLPEFFTWLTVHLPADSAEATVQNMVAAEAVNSHAMAERGTLVRLWRLPPRDGRARALGLWRTVDAEHMQAIVDALPMARMLEVVTEPLSVHPSDPAIRR